MNVVYGNLIEVVERIAASSDNQVVVIHGCNCQCRMGAGVAKDVATHWPEAQAADLATRKGDANKLGHWSAALVTRGEAQFEVINLYTQSRYGPSHERHFDMEAFTQGLHRLADYFTGQSVEFVFPLIGAGLGGGRWSVVGDRISTVLGGFKLTLVKLPPTVPR